MIQKEKTASFYNPFFDVICHNIYHTAYRECGRWESVVVNGWLYSELQIPVNNMLKYDSQDLTYISNKSGAGVNLGKFIVIQRLQSHGVKQAPKRIKPSIPNVIFSLYKQ